MNYETINVEEKTAGCLEVTINRPDQLNALNRQVIEELTSVCETQITPKIRVLLLKGAGDKAFVAGADIKEMESLTASEAEFFAKKGQRLTTLLETINCISVAVVQGFALGGGCELAMACDMIVASDKARFGQPEVNLGLVAGFGGTQRLAKQVGPKVAMDLLICGQSRMLKADEAKTLGLVSRVVVHDDLPEEVEKVVTSILSVGPKAAKLSKKLVRLSESCPLEKGLQMEASLFGSQFDTSEKNEGVQAFLEKRKPNF